MNQLIVIKCYKGQRPKITMLSAAVTPINSLCCGGGYSPYMAVFIEHFRTM